MGQSNIKNIANKFLVSKSIVPLIVKYEDSTKIECDSASYTKYCKPISKESK